MMKYYDSSQIFKQTEVIQEVVLSGTSKPNDLVQGTK